MYSFLPTSKKVAENEDLPDPKGYKLLIAIPEIEEKTEGGIILVDELRDKEKNATIIGLVVKMGDLSYQDTEKFPTDPWCLLGDWVVFRPYSGPRMTIREQEYRLINDDTVEAVVSDLVGFERGF